MAGPFTISATFDSTITSDPHASIIEASINQVISVYEADFSNPITVNITFAEMTTGLGASSTPLGSTSYSYFRSHLASHATDSYDATALANLPSSEPSLFAGDPVYVSLADATALGYSGLPNISDGTVYLNTSIMNLSRPDTNPSDYDLESVAMHEIDEVLGLGSGLNGGFNIRAEDLFRYSASGVRSYSTGAAESYLSIDGGVTSLVQFNQQNNGSDYGDWASNPLPSGASVQVQDAVGSPGTAPNLSAAELIALDVLGYDMSPGVLTPEPATIVLFFTGLAVCGRRFRRI